MARAGHNPVDTPRFPSDVIGVAVMEEGVFEPAATWEHAIRGAIEKQGFRADSRFFHGRGAAAGGPEALFQILRYAFEAGGAISLLITTEQLVRRRLQRRQDARVVGTDRAVPRLYVQLSHGRPIDTTVPPPLTTRDLVRVLPAVREVLEGHSNYIVDLEGGTRAGGSLCVYWLEPHDLKGRALRRLLRLSEQAQKRPDDIRTTGVSLRALFWQAPWKQQNIRKHSQ